MKCRIPKTRRVVRTLPIRLNERMTFTDLRQYVKDHTLVGMKVVLPGSYPKMIDLACVDMRDVIGEITEYHIGHRAGWINVSFGLLNESDFQQMKLVAVPRVFGEPKTENKFRIARIITFVIYPY